MDAKEAIERLKNYPKDWITSAGELVLPLEIELAIQALEKVPVLEAENARLTNLLNNANQALKRAGSSTQFHLKADDMPTGTIVFTEKEHPEDVFVEQYIEELNQEIKQLQKENARLREKETPKTLKMNGDWLSCPNCGCNFAGSIPNYCRECGQRFKNFKR